MHKICGDVEIVPRVVPAGGRGWEARVEVVFRGAEGQSLSGSQAVRPGCTFGSPREAMDAALTTLATIRAMRDAKGMGPELFSSPDKFHISEPLQASSTRHTPKKGSR